MMFFVSHRIDLISDQLLLVRNAVMLFFRFAFWEEECHVGGDDLKKLRLEVYYKISSPQRKISQKNFCHNRISYDF